MQHSRLQQLAGRLPFGVSRSLPFSMLLMLLTACGGDSCSCDGFATRDFPAEHYDKTVPQSTQVRLTPSGLAFIGNNVQPIIEEAVPGGLSFCLPKDTTSDTKLCFPYRNGMQPVCDDGQDGCQLNLTIDKAEIVPVPNNKLDVKATIGNLNPKIPFETDVAVLGKVSCDITVYKKGQSRTTPAQIEATLPITMDIDQMSPLKDLRIKLNEIALNLDDLDFHLDGNWKCGAATALRGLFRSTIENLVKDQLKDVVGDLTRDNLCKKCGAENNNATCPDNATCAGDGVCDYNNSNECVPVLLGVEGGLIFGDLLADYTETKDAEVDLSVRAADYVEVNTGVNLAVRTGFQPNKFERCVPVDPQSRPPFAPIPISPTITADTKPSGGPFMVGIGVHKLTIEHMLWSTWASGATCLSVDSKTVDVLSTASLGLLVRSLRDLADNKTRTVEIKIVPQTAPKIVLGENTVAEEGDKLVIRDGLMKIDWKDFDINMYGYIQDRYTLLFTVRTDLELPVSLVPADGKLQVVIGDIDKALTNIRVLNHKLLKEDPEKLKDALPSLLGVALPALASSLADLSVDLPEFFGFRLKLEQGDVTSVDNKSFIAIFANLEPVMMTQSGNARVNTSVLNTNITYPNGEGLLRPTVKLDLAGHWDLPVKVQAKELEYSYRVNKGFWSLFQSGDTLEINDAVLAWPGHHTVEVKARVKGQPYTVDRTPVVLDVHIDYTAPELTLNRAANTLTFAAIDAGDRQDELSFRYRVHDGQSASQWTTWNKANTLDLASLAVTKRARVEVQVKDKKGHVTTKNHTFTPNKVLAKSISGGQTAEPKAGGCAAVGSTQTPVGGLATMLLLGMGLFGLRRRKNVLTATMALLSAVGLTSMVGCSDDTANQQTNKCEPACGLGQVCKANKCVDAANKCNSDVDCEGGDICENNLCVAPACTKNSDCKETCGDEKNGVCASGRCACEDFCPEGCGDGELCCYPSNSCKPIPDACEGKVCDPGFEARITTTGTPDGKTCSMAGAVCDCVKLDPLPLGFHGQYSALAESNDEQVVTVYNKTYGDLMVGTLSSNLEPTWQFVDGVPANGTVAGALDGPRQGVKDAGDQVGTHTASVFDGGGVLHVFYRDEDNKALKYARGTKGGSGYTFTTHTVDTEGDAGVWTQAIFKDGKVHVVYTAKNGASTDGLRSQIRHLSFEPSAAPDQLGTPAVVLEGAPANPCGEKCQGNAVCFVTAGTCAEPTDSCGTCGDGQQCNNGTCDGVYDGSKASDVELMTGQFMDLSVTPNGLLLVFYDHTAQSVGWTTLEGDNWAMPQYVGTPSGPYASAMVDGNGVVHLAYMNEVERKLMYEQVGQNVREEIADGLRDTGTQWLLGRIGEDVVLRVKADGNIQVVYNDATLHQLKQATRTAAGQWDNTIIGQAGDPYDGEHGFYGTMLRVGGQTIAVEYVINNQDKTPYGKPVFYTIP